MTYEVPARQVITVTEAAADIRCSKQHIINAIEAGSLVALNIGSKSKAAWRVAMGDWIRWKHARRTVKE